jgi:hypothetical protein
MVVKDFERRVFEPRSGDERLQALRLVLSTKEPAKIDGMFVEYHWARMILQVYETLDPEVQRQLAGTPLPRIRGLIDEWAKEGPRGPGSSA